MAEIELLALDLDAAGELGALLVVGLHRGGEAGLHGREIDAPFRTLRAGHRGLHRREIELERVGEDGVRGLAGGEQPLRLAIGLDEGDAVGLAAGHGEIVQRLGVDREEAAGGAVFGAHIGDGGAVGERQVVEAGSEELDELADNALLAQHLGDGQHQIGRGDAFLQRAGQLEADHLRQQHRLRLAEHGGLGLDAADAPAENREAVDHGGVRIGADQRVRIGDLDLSAVDGLVAGPDGLRQIFEVDLVADARARRHDAEIVEGELAPFQELVALLIALIFELDIAGEGLGRTEFVDDDGMVDNEIDRHQRVDLLGVAAQRLDAVTHRREVDHGGNAGEVLHQHARRAEADLLAGLALVVEPGDEALDIGLGDRAAILEAQQVLQQHLHREGQLGNPGEPIGLGIGERIIGVGLAVRDERLAAFEGVERGHAI